MTPLNIRFQPPAATVEVRLQNPSDPQRVLQTTGLVDTDSDLSVLPVRSIERLKLPKRSPVEISGVDGLTLTRASFIVNLEFAGARLERRRVITWDGDLVIIGRDLLIEFSFVFDGKNHQFELRDP